MKQSKGEKSALAEVLKRKDGHSSERGLWDNIRDRKAAGKKARKPGSPGAPTKEAFKKSQAESDCLVPGTDRDYLMESPLHKILKGELSLNAAGEPMAPGDIFKYDKGFGLVLSGSRFGDGSFYWIPSDESGLPKGNAYGEIRVSHSNSLLSKTPEKIGHKDLEKHEAEGFVWFDCGNEKVDNEQMPHLDSRMELFNKMAPKHFLDLYARQEDQNYHPENALMVALFADWIESGQKAEDFTMDEEELETLSPHNPQNQEVESSVTLASTQEIREALADMFHQAWEHWSKAVKDDIKSPERVTRWQEYWVPYDQLDESTKDMDREWADKALESIEKYIKEGKTAKEMVTRVTEAAETVKIDMEKLRQDLSNATNSEDGLKPEHISLPDEELIEKFMHVYGDEAIDPYIIVVADTKEAYPRADVLAGVFKEMAIEQDDQRAFLEENLEKVRAKRDAVQNEMDHLMSEQMNVPKFLEMQWRDLNSIEQEYEEELKKLGAS
jgi:hypothetical protein